MENQENKIEIKQLPSITHQFEKAGIAVRKRISDLDLEKQIVTEDSIQSIKKLRAELNKESATFKLQVKTVIDEVEKPLNEFKEQYKIQIEEPYKEADSLLKDKTGIFENQIKKAKKENIEEYFSELCLAESIDFIKFDQLNIEINLSTSEKKYKEQVNSYITKVIDDLALIKATDYEAETLTEYKVSINVSKAITTVKTRKEEEEKEKAKIKAELIQNRKNALIKLGLNYVEITNQYEYNEEIFVSLSDVINRTKEEFIAIHAEVTAKIKTDIESKAIEVIAPEIINETSTEIKTVVAPKKTISVPLSAPKIEIVAEEIKTASFEVKATMTKLRALGVYMKENGIEYRNI